MNDEGDGADAWGLLDAAASRSMTGVDRAEEEGTQGTYRTQGTNTADGAVMTPLIPFYSPYHNRHPHADKNGKSVVAILVVA